MRSLFATLQELSIPMGAPSGSPHIRLGPNLPAPLKAVPEADLTAAAIWYFDESQFFFIASGTWTTQNTQLVLIGIYDTHNGLTIYQRYAPFLVPAMAWGSSVFDTNHPSINFNDVDLVLPFGTLLDIAGGFTVDGNSAPRGYQGAIVVDSGTAATSSGGEVAIGAYDIQPTLTWYDQRIYRLDAQVHVAGTVASTPYRVRVYHGANLLLAFDGETTVNTTVRRSQSAVGWCYNNSGATITGVLTATIQRTAGSGSVSLYGDSLTPLSVTCSDATALGNSIGFAARSL